MSFTIQAANWRDLKALNRLEHECFDEDAYPFLDLIGLLVMPGLRRLKAVIDQQMIGFIGGEIDGKMGWIITLCVKSEYRKRGIATALLKACESDLNTSFIRLCARYSNEPAICLYKRQGYSIVTTWKKYYNDGEDALVMEKEIRR